MLGIITIRILLGFAFSSIDIEHRVNSSIFVAVGIMLYREGIVVILSVPAEGTH